MGNKLLSLMATASLLIASAVAQSPKPESRLGLFDLLSAAEKHVAVMLASAKPLAELATDETIFTRRFREIPAQRGLGWRHFAVTGKPGVPAAFDSSCKANSTDALVNGLANAMASSKVEGQVACHLLARCTVRTTRETGCYEVKVDVCISPLGEARIDKVTGGTKFTELNFKNSKGTPCSRAASLLQ